MNTKKTDRLKKEKQTPSTMKAFKSVLRRVCEIPYPVAQLRISAPDTLVYELIEEFEERGQTPDFGSEISTGRDVVSFGPLLVHVDDDLPPDTFMIKFKSPDERIT